MPQDGAQNKKKNTGKKNEETERVIGHGRGQTEADRGEIGTELMQIKRRRRKNRAKGRTNL